MDNKTYFDLNREEIKNLSALNLKEQAAVDALMAAVKALPKNICIAVQDSDDDPSEPNFTVSKRITRGSATRVAGLRKKSLYF